MLKTRGRYKKIRSTIVLTLWFEDGIVEKGNSVFQEFVSIVHTQFSLVLHVTLVYPCTQYNGTETVANKVCFKKSIDMIAL